jgi:hypothetical protein
VEAKAVWHATDPIVLGASPWTRPPGQQYEKLWFAGLPHTHPWDTLGHTRRVLSQGKSGCGCPKKGKWAVGAKIYYWVLFVLLGRTLRCYQKSKLYRNVCSEKHHYISHSSSLLFP